jgi:hypothetical protein
MRLLTAAILASLSAACAHRSAAMPEMAPLVFEGAVAAPPVLVDNHFSRDKGAIGEAELRAILSSPVFLEEGARLGVVPVASRYELDGEVPQESTPAEVSDTLEQSGLFELTTEVSTDWPTDRGVSGLRELAGRYRTEYLLLYRQRFNEETHSNGWAALYPTVIGAFVAPGETVEQAGVLEATLFDVKTGTILFTVHERIRGDVSTTPPLANRRGAELRKKLLAEAAPKLAHQVVAKCRRLAAARPPAEGAPKVSIN